MKAHKLAAKRAKKNLKRKNKKYNPGKAHDVARSQLNQAHAGDELIIA